MLYYVARFTESGRQCISYAVSDHPAGPFVDLNPEPFVCQLDQGGSIDPEPFVAPDGSLYLLWKNDGSRAAACRVALQPAAQRRWTHAAGRTASPDPKDQAWEEPLIENPTMYFHDGKYYLLYSANWYEGPNYAVGYAVCDSPSGPCTSPGHADPRLRWAARGAGETSFFTDADGSLWLAYHAWIVPNVGYPVGMRQLHLERVTFEGGDLQAGQPMSDDQ
ncbi:MAG: family 43 glycosylhydrolase [Caldilineaceae bacterium]